MTDTELIYNALLRAERRLEEKGRNAPNPDKAALARFSLEIVAIIREEVGNGIEGQSR